LRQPLEPDQNKSNFGRRQEERTRKELDKEKEMIKPKREEQAGRMK